MSRKSVSIVLPQKGAKSRNEVSNVTPIPGLASSRAESGAERWVRQEAPAPAALTFTIPAEPDWFHVMRIGLFLPQIAFWYWTVNATKRNLSLFLR